MVYPSIQIKYSFLSCDGNFNCRQAGFLNVVNHRVEIPIKNPHKWDAEHPNLYTLRASLVLDGVVVETISEQFGFREVEKAGNKLLVNGNVVKLRGGCRHDAHPTKGRAISPDLDEKDVILFRDANINFIRTSHYPPSEAFLDFCDKYGMYVEEETAMCFSGFPIRGTTWPYYDDPLYLARHMEQFAEMIERDRSHPGVIIWSLGNESKWGKNVQKQFEYVKLEDPGRPVIWSYPRFVPEGISCYDIYSSHYPGYESQLRNEFMPVLYDEYCHVACYNRRTLQRDPGVRDFWGETLKHYWDNMIKSDGCLGGAIWGLVDEVFMLPDTCVGYGAWGIIDGWRREKPEYWLTKKAYSPIKIDEKNPADVRFGHQIKIPLMNQFGHTNLNEITVQWSAGADKGTISGPDIPPHCEGYLELPVRSWNNGDILKLAFIRGNAILVDEYTMPLGEEKIVSFPPVQGPAPKVHDESSKISIRGSNFELEFNKETGLLQKGTYDGIALLEGGPFLNLGYAESGKWSPISISSSVNNDEAIVNILGKYDTVSVDFEVRIDGAGLITTQYIINSIPRNCTEAGVVYLLSSKIDRLEWERKAQWSAYPEDHIGRAKGIAWRTRKQGAENYRIEPAWPWAFDIRDYYYFGADDAGNRGTNDFRSQKCNIWYASCIAEGTDKRIRVESDGSCAVMVEVQPEKTVKLHINNEWKYVDLGFGNIKPEFTIQSRYSNFVRMRFLNNDYN